MNTKPQTPRNSTKRRYYPLFGHELLRRLGVRACSKYVVWDCVVRGRKSSKHAHRAQSAAPCSPCPFFFVFSLPFLVFDWYAVVGLPRGVSHAACLPAPPAVEPRGAQARGCSPPLYLRCEHEKKREGERVRKSERDRFYIHIYIIFHITFSHIIYMDYNDGQTSNKTTRYASRATRENNNFAGGHRPACPRFVPHASATRRQSFGPLTWTTYH